tara:strand:+ start:435 stop:548 length:114 start_codon:yes stop_codon:yes gene_type:complete
MPTDAFVMTIVLIMGLIYFKAQKQIERSKEILSDEEE